MCGSDSTNKPPYQLEQPELCFHGSRFEDRNLWYGRYEPDVSDHRPVYGAYRVVVQKVEPKGVGSGEETVGEGISVALRRNEGFYEGQ
jgi:hypothetical protein